MKRESVVASGVVSVEVEGAAVGGKGNQGSRRNRGYDYDDISFRLVHSLALYWMEKYGVMVGYRAVKLEYHFIKFTT